MKNRQRYWKDLAKEDLNQTIAVLSLREIPSAQLHSRTNIKCISVLTYSC